MNDSTKVQVDINGVEDPKHHIKYIGKATQMEDGTWRCMANVEGNLCLVEVNIKLRPEDLRSSAFSCSFCGKPSGECDVLIAGPMVNICAECIETAQDCVDDAREAKTSKKVEFVKHVPSDSICESCLHCAPAPSPFVSEYPWWMGVCTEGFKLDSRSITNKSCPRHWASTKQPPPLGCQCKERATALGIDYKTSTSEQISGECCLSKGADARQEVKGCSPPKRVRRERVAKHPSGFLPTVCEFSGCRCAHCPEREGTGECSCCAERREEEKNPGPDPFV